MKPNSGEMLVKMETESPVYASSRRTSEAEVWIQPSIVVSALGDTEVTILDGIYVSTSRSQMDPWRFVEPALAEEFKSWDLASDEALALLEAQLD
jgi:hypothetical protein